MAPKKSKIGKRASSATRQQFAEEIARRTSFTEQEVKQLFPRQADRDELNELMKIVRSAAHDNRKKARLINNISKVGGAVLKISKRALGQ